MRLFLRTNSTRRDVSESSTRTLELAQRPLHICCSIEKYKGCFVPNKPTISTLFALNVSTCIMQNVQTSAVQLKNIKAVCPTNGSACNVYKQSCCFIAVMNRIIKQIISAQMHLQRKVDTNTTNTQTMLSTFNELLIQTGKFAKCTAKIKISQKFCAPRSQICTAGKKSCEHVLILL